MDLTGIATSSPIKYPIESKYISDLLYDKSEVLNKTEKTYFIELASCIGWLTTRIRPDLVFGTSKLR